MAPNEFDLGNVIGGLTTEVRMMRGEQNQRHCDNLDLMKSTNHRVESLEAKVNSLWQFRSRIIVIAGAVVTVAGYFVHVTSDWFMDLIRGTGHG